MKHDIVTLYSHLMLHYRWLVVVGAMFFGMLLFHWVSRKVYDLLLAQLDNGKHLWLVSFIKSVHVPWLIFFWLFTFSFIFPMFMLHFRIDLTHLQMWDTMRSLFFIGAIYWSLMLYIKNLEQVIAPRWSYGPIRDKTTVRAIAQLSRVVLTLVTILAILPFMGVRTGSLLAFGGASGIVAGFAARDMLSNFLGGMMIFLDRPFSVGDWIRSPDRNIEGTVEYIGWRLTRIRTFSKRPLYVPNSVFSTVSIENPSRMTNRQINAVIGVRYDDATKIDEIVREIDEMLHAHPGMDATQTMMVHFTQFDASSLNINIYAFTKTTDWKKYRDVQQDVFLKTIGIIAKHGAECAFPTTTVLVPEPVSFSDQAAIELENMKDDRSSKPGSTTSENS